MAFMVAPLVTQIIPGRAAWPLVALLLGGCGAGDAAPAEEAHLYEPSTTAVSQPLPAAGAARTPDGAADAGPAPQELTQSRVTAIVRASERVAPSVVSVNVIRSARIRPRSLWEEFFLPPGAARTVPGLGSGFVIDEEGHIITNDHVVSGAERMMVTLPDGRDFEAELVGTDNVTDVAVLKIEADNLSVAPLGTSQGLLIGEWTVAIGNPFGNLMSNPEPSVTAGVISAVGRHIIPSSREDGFYLGMIQTDASINPGNSGGPLVNALGEVIGVNSNIFSVSGGNEGLGFAIPIDRALRVAGDLIRHGEVQRAWLGVQVEPVEADAWGRTRGVRISAVAPGSPADGEGLEAGSNILAANGSRVATPLDFEAKLLDLRTGDAITLQIEGRRSPLRIVATTLPSVTAERVTVLEDLELITVTPEIRTERNVMSEVGTLVVGISPELSRILALRTGDVLLMINQTRISTAEEANQAFRAVAGRGRVRIYAERNGQVFVHTFYWGR